MKVQWLPQSAAYEAVWHDMREFTAGRTIDTADEIWLCEHTPVYTLGQAGREEHLLSAGNIPVVKSDRGGQITYHGPGQVVAYAMVDLRRAGLFVKDYVTLLEEAALATLRDVGVDGACRRAGAPGIYVPDPFENDVDGYEESAPNPIDRGVDSNGGLAKIAALGVKIRNGRAYHGLSLNVAMDLTPFLGINPCGYAGLRTVDLETLGIHVEVREVGDLVAGHIARLLSEPRKALPAVSSVSATSPAAAASDAPR
jgi:lipoyl(octanoyl) transferase